MSRRTIRFYYAMRYTRTLHGFWLTTGAPLRRWSVRSGEHIPIFMLIYIDSYLQVLIMTSPPTRTGSGCVITYAHNLYKAMRATHTATATTTTPSLSPSTPSGARIDAPSCGPYCLAVDVNSDALQLARRTAEHNGVREAYLWISSYYAICISSQIDEFGL
jgi:hypothetical protein